MLVKDRLLVEHNMSSLIESYRYGDWFTKDIDLKMQFTQFILDFYPEEIDYGISYLKEQEQGLFELLYPIILDYQTYGLKHFKEEDPIIEEEKPKTFLDKIKDFFKEDKIKVDFKRN